MRENYPGLLAWTMFLLGLFAGGLWIILLATSGAPGAVPAGIVALVLLTGAFAIWMTLRLRFDDDPLEPEITEPEAQLYRDQQEAVDRAVREAQHNEAWQNGSGKSEAAPGRAVETGDEARD